LKTVNNQIQRWILPKPINNDEINNCAINYILQKVISRRGINIKENLDEFISPSELPNAEEHFHELKKASQRIIDACINNEKIAICGDYDADGITSTVLLVELFNKLGGIAIPYIPSRQEDGYGLNVKMINEIHLKEIKLIITVDNGISAFDAIKRSNKLGIDLIITDHHKIPSSYINSFALIHPELCPNNSPYKYLSGVGIAFLLSKYLCYKFNYDIDNTTADVLFCIGTVADMAPLVGANRKWLKEYLPKINNTKNIGIRSIIHKLSIDKIDITSEDIGYKIAPLINAVGRISDPKIIIDLLLNPSITLIDELTDKCFAINRERKRITSLVENEVMPIAYNEFSDNSKFLVLTKREWHPGIIGIVASRVVEKFNLPTAILSVANDGLFRGSIRSNELVKVNHALDECKDLLISYGGHSAAAGFTIKEENIPFLKDMLNKIAIREMNNTNISKYIKPDAYIAFRDINFEFYRQLMLLGPFGIKNPNLIFWTRKCKIINLFYLKGNHVRIILDDGTETIEAIQWNSSKQLKVNDLIDIAFHIEINNWKKQKKIQLNIIDIKNYINIVELNIHNRIYKCKLMDNNKVIVTNKKGQTISSDLLLQTKNKINNEDIYTNKILALAEIALGKVA
tara:strand:- start:1294 stop:3183 length:1890 start_codon:yes stop_codon:yes gene_type:complete